MEVDKGRGGSASPHTAGWQSRSEDDRAQILILPTTLWLSIMRDALPAKTIPREPARRAGVVERCAAELHAALG